MFFFSRKKGKKTTASFGTKQWSRMNKEENKIKKKRATKKKKKKKKKDEEK